MERFQEMLTPIRASLSNRTNETENVTKVRHREDTEKKRGEYNRNTNFSYNQKVCFTCGVTGHKSSVCMTRNNSTKWCQHCKSSVHIRLIHVEINMKLEIEREVR